MAEEEGIALEFIDEFGDEDEEDDIDAKIKATKTRTTTRKTSMTTTKKRTCLRLTLSIVGDESKLPDFVRSKMKTLVHKFLKDTRNVIISTVIETRKSK